ncbi:MAG: tetratricopeptide repeat protein [Planctomycetes bacterium]|nr:tetratricopeptide repeat protein [Planctomycetota bacterium]
MLASILALALFASDSVPGPKATQCTQAEDMTADQAYGKGTALFQQGKYVEAIIYLTEAIEKDNAYFAAYVNRGSCYNGVMQYDKAIADFDRAEELAPEHPFPNVNRGNTYRMMGQYAVAMEQYEKALEKSPDFEPALNGRALCRFYLGQAAVAIKEINSLISKNPENVDYICTRGFLLLAMGAYDKAIADFNAALKLKPQHIDALVNRGCSYWRKGDLQKAKDDFDSVIKSAPDHANAYSNRAQILRYTDMKAALEDAEMAVKLAGGSLGSLRVRAEIFRCALRFDDAIADYTACLKLDPQHKECMYYIALAYYQKKDAKSSREWFEKLGALDPKYPYLDYQIGHCYKQEKKYDEAIASYRKAQELQDGVFIHVSIAECLAAKGDAVKARDEIAIAEKLAEQLPGVPQAEVLYTKACVASISSLTHGKGKKAEAAAQADVERAVTYLEDARKEGFWDYAHIETDEDIAPIRKHKRYEKLIKEMKLPKQDK